MILFKLEMAQAIIEGRKTVTRRRWDRPRVKVGSVHLCYTRPAFARPPGKPFAKVRIVSWSWESQPMKMERALLSVTNNSDQINAEARREGFKDWKDFQVTYMVINGATSIDEPCYRIEFELVEVLL